MLFEKKLLGGQFLEKYKKFKKSEESRNKLVWKLHWSFAIKKISIAQHYCQSTFQIKPNTKKTLKICPRLLKFCPSGEISPLWQYSESPWAIFKSLNLCLAIFQPTLANCYATGQVSIVTNGSKFIQSDHLVSL